MLELIFTLGYQQQIRRTRPELYASLENSIITLIGKCGGKTQKEHKHITAFFNEDTIAFRLDLVIFIENLEKILKNSLDELYGYSCLIGRGLSGNALHPGILRELASHGTYSGIWLSPELRPHFEPYFEFDDKPGKSFITGTSFQAIQVKRIRDFPDTGTPANNVYPLRKGVAEALEQQKKNPRIVLAGPCFIGIRDGLYHYCRMLQEPLPLLVFRFGAGGRGLSCISDALDTDIREFFSGNGSADVLKELEIPGTLIGRERLRDEYSPAMKRKGEQFLSLLTDTYIKLAKKYQINPIIILENIEEIDPDISDIISRKIQSLQQDTDISIYCTSNCENNLEAWKELGFAVMQLTLPEGKSIDSIEAGSGKNLSRELKELWEIAYICYLSRPYFPGESFLSLFGEEGKNPQMVSRAFDILDRLGIIHSRRDPEPRIRDFPAKAEKILGERTEMLRATVRKWLMNWVAGGKLLPCFNLLSALVRLGSGGEDDLILDALYRDVIDGVYSRFRDSVASGQVSGVAGSHRAAALTYIFNTLAALIHGNETSIREAFLEAVPAESPNPRYTSYILSNLAAFRFSIHALEDAAESAKGSMLAVQSLKNVRGGARAFRLFALVNLAQGEIADAIEYLEFGAEYAQRSKDREEAVIIDYYSSIVHFLYGNISKAERLAAAAEEGAFDCGIIPWADKARFLKGRIAFEKGKYQEALDIFKSIDKAGDGEKEKVLDAWIFRAEIFAKGHSLVSPEHCGEDGTLFGIEASYMAKKYPSTVELADQMLVNLPADHFIFIEQVDWHSGFAQTELLLFPKTDLWYRLASVYRALALSNTAANDAVREQAVSIMQQITREQKFPDTDINDAFYYFAFYKVLQNTGASEIDLNTMISMAFKRLQRRASRIDNIDAKRSFLSLNRWNKALGEAAKRHKLI